MGILINGQYLNNITYADDTVVFAHIQEDLQEHVTGVVDIS